MQEGVRYQIYATADGHVLFMASEQEFWKNFCEAVGRMDLFESWPGEQYADHARNNHELHVLLRDIFKTKTSAEWIEFGNDAQHADRTGEHAEVDRRRPAVPGPAAVDRRDRLDCEQLPFPVKLIGEELPVPTMAPTPGEHTDAVLREVLGYDDAKIEQLRDAEVVYGGSQ